MQEPNRNRFRMSTNLSEKLLLFFSKDCEEGDKFQDKNNCNISDSLAHLKDAFGSSFIRSIAGKDILDFGCGLGYQCVAMALHGARRVIGVDILEENIDFGKRLALKHKVTGKTEFFQNSQQIADEKFDLIISQNCFEHYNDPLGVLRLFDSLSLESGKILITFGPLWLSPYGSHMHFFTKFPYINILFSEKTVMNVRRHYRDDGANTYEEVEGGLNKMTIAKFEGIVCASGLRVDYLKKLGVRNLNLLTKIPFLQELITNRIDCIFSKK